MGLPSLLSMAACTCDGVAASSSAAAAAAILPRAARRSASTTAQLPLLLLGKRQLPSSSSSLRTATRLLSTSTLRNQTVAEAREKYENKYAERLQAKAKEKGLKDIKDLREQAMQEGKLTPRMKELLSRKQGEKYRQPLMSKIDPQAQGSAADSSGKTAGTASASAKRTSAAPAKPRIGERKDKSPIKPLDEIVDLAKLISEPAETVTKIWNGYHQSLATTPTLSAVIPYETYRKMAETGAKYPSFVVPLPRELVVEPQQKGTKESEGTAGGEEGGLPEQKDAKSIGAEMHFLQWAFHSQPAESGLPAASTVLYTPLALFKTQQTYAQPHLILTHYTDLVPSHGIVLMRGDVTPDVSTKIGDGQVLTLRLQQFYQGANERRTNLLKTFHEKPEEFSVDELVDSVGEV